MYATWASFISRLDPTLARDASLPGYMKLFANAGTKADEVIPTLRPSDLAAAGPTLYGKSIYDSARAEGLGIKLFQAMSIGPSGSFDPIWFRDSLMGFSVPGLSNDENRALSRYIFGFYTGTNTAAQNNALLAAHAKWIQDHPTATSYFLYLPENLLRQAQLLATHPIEALKEAIDSANHMFGVDLKKWGTYAVAAVALYIFLPRIVKGMRG